MHNALCTNLKTMKKLTTLILMGMVCGAVCGQTEYWDGEKNVNSDISRYGNISLNNSGNITGIGENGYVNFHRMKFVGGFQSLGDIGGGHSYYAYLSNGGSHVINGGPYDFNCLNKWVDVTALTLSRSGFSFLFKDCDAVGEVKLNELMRVTSSGNVGIGNAAPKSKLVVSNNNYSGDNAWAFTVDSKTSDSSSAIVNFRKSNAHSVLYIRGDGNSGLGTTAPLAKLHIASFHGHETGVYSGYGDLLLYNHSNAKAQLGATLVFGSHFENGSGNGFSTRAAIKGGTSIYGNTGAGYLAFYTVPTGLANQNTERMRIDHKGNIGIGTTTPSSKLDVAGDIKAQEIEVTLASINDMQLNGTLAANNITYTANGNTADFVFEDNYQLKDLTEVEAFIKANKHLPEIPSAAEMEESGINLAEMNKLLLMKVEELTLYSIEQEKKIEGLTEDRRRETEENNEKVKSLEFKVEELSEERRAMRGEMDKVTEVMEERLKKMEALLVELLNR